MSFRTVGLANLDLALVNKVEDVIEVLTLDPGEEDRVGAGGGRARGQGEHLSEPRTVAGQHNLVGRGRVSVLAHEADIHELASIAQTTEARGRADLGIIAEKVKCFRHFLAKCFHLISCHITLSSNSSEAHIIT